MGVLRPGPNSQDVSQQSDGRARNSEAAGANPAILTTTMPAKLMRMSSGPISRRQLVRIQRQVPTTRGCTWCETSLPTKSPPGSTPGRRSTCPGRRTVDGLLSRRLQVRILLGAPYPRRQNGASPPKRRCVGASPTEGAIRAASPTAEAPDLNPGQCWFESSAAHQVRACSPIGRGFELKPRMLMVRFHLCAPSLRGEISKRAASRALCPRAYRCKSCRRNPFPL